MWAITKKELKTYFLSPIGYVFIGLFLAMCSLFFYITAVEGGLTNYEYMFYYAAQSLTFITPILTMRMFAEERKNGTEQLLLTSPRSMVGVTLGKFFAAVLVVLITEVLTFVYFAILSYFKMPSLTTTFTTLLGFLLLSMAYISFGILSSSLTESPIISGILTFGFVFASTWLPYFIEALSGFSLMDLFINFLYGQIDITSTILFITLTILCLIITMIIMQRRKSVK